MGGGGGGVLPLQKGLGPWVLFGNFEKNPEEVPRSCFVGVNFFSPLREVHSFFSNSFCYSGAELLNLLSTLVMGLIANCPSHTLSR